MDDLFQRQKVASQECAEGNRSESSDLTTETADVSESSSNTSVTEPLCSSPATSTSQSMENVVECEIPESSDIVL